MSKQHLIPLLGVLAALVVIGGTAAAQDVRAPGLREYDTRYYRLYTDLSPAEAHQAGLRMTAMVEEYQRRTRGFAGVLREKLPFYLFRNREDYLAAGGMKGSSGVFTGSALMAVAGDRLTRASWHIIQHEGFHQFASRVIGGQLPTWVNEGLADYFGEALYTGDGFLSGAVPGFRLKRVQTAIREGRVRPLREMMRLSRREWNAQMGTGNYDQAWSMVHFLAHGDGGKYQRAFGEFILLAGRGQQADNAWEQTFGTVDGFERRWREYWLNLPADATAALYAQASATIYTKLLGEVVAAGQPAPDSWESLLRVVGELPADSVGELYVPSLLEEANNPTARHMSWSIVAGAGAPTLAGEMSDGTRLVGSFVLRGGRVTDVKVEVDDLVPVLREARALMEGGKKREAAALVRQGLRRLPRSPAAEQARQLLQELR